MYFDKNWTVHLSGEWFSELNMVLTNMCHDMCDTFINKSGAKESCQQPNNVILINNNQICPATITVV